MIFRISNNFNTLDGYKITLAVNTAEMFLQHKLSVILGQSSFTFTDDTPERVFNHLASEFTAYQNGRAPILVEPWKPFNPWTSAVATTFKNKPGVIFINVRKINQRSAIDYARTLVHEWAHVSGYGHGSNSNQGSTEKLKSVPIWLANQV